jgi:hypothetical protein
MRFVFDELSIRQGFLRALRLSSRCHIPLLLHTYLPSTDHVHYWLSEQNASKKTPTQKAQTWRNRKSSQWRILPMMTHRHFRTAMRIVQTIQSSGSTWMTKYRPTSWRIKQSFEGGNDTLSRNVGNNTQHAAPHSRKAKALAKPWREFETQNNYCNAKFSSLSLSRFSSVMSIGR